MKEEPRVLLDRVIVEDLQNLSSTVTCEERAARLKELTQLYELRIEEIKAEHARDTLAKEQEDKRAESKAHNLDRWVNVAVQVGLAVAGFVAYDIWNRRGLRFEETGTISSPMTRNLLSRMIPKK